MPDRWRGARVVMESREQARFRRQPPATEPGPARAILPPRLSPDGSSEVLRLATVGAAGAVRASADPGSLEVGKPADLVLLDADPLSDMRNTQKTWRVIKDGRVFDPERLRTRAPDARPVPPASEVSEFHQKEMR